LAPLQSTQAPLVGPQAAGEAPIEQVPALQQPPLQGWLPLHEVTHWCIARLHDEPAGQSPVLLQPQLPPPLVARHCAPRLLVLQSAHSPPESPHTPSVVPATHWPFEQQPPLHGWVAEH
jgi:hypothetical protein